MWRFLRNRRLILHLDYFLGTHTLGTSRGGPCDSVAFCLFFWFFQSPTANTPARIFTLNTSNDVVLRKKVPFGGLKMKFNT